jgi:hypothetical protein
MFVGGQTCLAPPRLPHITSLTKPSRRTEREGGGQTILGASGRYRATERDGSPTFIFWWKSTARLCGKRRPWRMKSQNRRCRREAGEIERSLTSNSYVASLVWPFRPIAVASFRFEPRSSLASALPIPSPKADRLIPASFRHPGLCAGATASGTKRSVSRAGRGSAYWGSAEACVRFVTIDARTMSGSTSNSLGAFPHDSLGNPINPPILLLQQLHRSDRRRRD